MLLKLLVTGFILAPSALYSKDKVLKFGVVPQQNISTIRKNWKPVADALKKEGILLAIQSKKNHSDFNKDLMAAKWDMVYVNPLQYVNASKSQLYSAFAKQKGKILTGIMVAKKSSPLPFGDLKALEGKTVGFPAEKAFAATILVKAALKKAGIKYKAKYAGNHEKSYSGVIRNSWDVGTGVRRSFESNKVITDNLKIVFETKGYTPHALAFNTKLPKEIKEKVQTVLFKLDASAFKKLNYQKGIEAAQDSDWDGVREVVNELNLSH